MGILQSIGNAVSSFGGGINNILNGRPWGFVIPTGGGFVNPSQPQFNTSTLGGTPTPPSPPPSNNGGGGSSGGSGGGGSSGGSGGGGSRGGGGGGGGYSPQSTNSNNTSTEFNQNQVQQNFSTANNSSPSPNFTGTVAVSQNGTQQEQQYFYNGNQVATYYPQTNEYKYSGQNGGNYSIQTPSENTAFSPNAYASQTYTPVYSQQDNSYRGVVGTISAPPSFGDIIHEKGFLGALQYEFSNLLPSSVFKANLGGGRQTQYSTSSGFSNLVFDVPYFIPAIGNAYAVLKGVETYVTPAGKLNLYMQSQSLQSIGLGETPANIVSYSLPAVNIVAGTFGGYSETTAEIRALSLETNFVGVQSTINMGAKGGETYGVVNTNIISKTDIPRFFGGFKTSYEPLIASTQFSTIAGLEGFQIGKTEVLGTSSQFKGIVPTLTAQNPLTEGFNLPSIESNIQWGKPVLISAREVSFSQEIRGGTIDQYTSQKTLGEVQSIKINDLTKGINLPEGNTPLVSWSMDEISFVRYTKNPSKDYFIGSQTSYGNSPVIIGGSAFKVNGGEIDFAGTFKGAIFTEKFNLPSEDLGITSFQGGYRKSSSEFLNSLYSTQGGIIGITSVGTSYKSFFSGESLKIVSASGIVYKSNLKIEQSIYYGTGMYERTETLSVISLPKSEFKLAYPSNFSTSNNSRSSFSLGSSSLSINKELSTTKNNLSLRSNFDVLSKNNLRFNLNFREASASASRLKIRNDFNQNNTHSQIKTFPVASGFPFVPFAFNRTQNNIALPKGGFKLQIKVKKNFLTFGSNLSLKNADFLGRKITGNTLTATYRIISPSGNLVNLPTPKGYYRNRRGSFVEFPKLRLNTSGEIGAIQSARRLSMGRLKI